MLSVGENAILAHGPSSRAGLALIAGAKALAAISGRDFVRPDDIKTLCPFVLSHRIALSYFGVTHGESIDQVIDTTLNSIAILND